METVAFMVLGWIHKGYKKMMSGHTRRAVISTNIVLTAVSICILIFVAPEYANKWIYQNILIRWYYVVPGAISFAVVFYVWKHKTKFITGKEERNRHKLKHLLFDRRPVLILGAVIVANIAWTIVAQKAINFWTYQIYAQAIQRTSMVATNIDTVQYNARHVVFNDMSGIIKSAVEDVVYDYTYPVIIDNRFNFVTPIILDGIKQTFMGKNPGFIVYDDSSEFEHPERRVNQKYTIGQDMQWRDNLQYRLYLSDFFAVYETPHYLVLDETKPEVFVAVVPKIKYRWFALPYWAGTTLVHSDGTIEDLSRKEAMQDKRLMKKWISPRNLARKYVQLQNYAVGFFNSFFRVEGKLNVSELPGDSQFPLLMHGADSDTYHIIETRAEGGGVGMFRMYYVTVDTFSMTYYEYPKDTVVFGAKAALDRIQNLKGYNWHRKSDKGESGNMIPIEPRYILRPGDTEMYWMFTITNKEYNGASAVAVSRSSKPTDIVQFEQEDRSRFKEWLTNVDVDNFGNELGAIKALINKLQKRVLNLEQMR